MRIESLQNKKVKEWNKLKEKKYRDITNCFLIEGDHLLKEALKSGSVREIISDDKKFKEENIPFFEVNTQILYKLSNQKSGTNVLAVAEKIPSKPIKGKICILDDIQDPGNLGTIIRSALAFGIDTLILSLNTVDLYNDKVIRASEGMLFHINVIKEDLKRIIPQLKKEGYQIFGTDVKKSTDINQIDFPDKSAIIIGNEGQGMNANLKPLCDEFLTIPIHQKCESLNASIAASIIFYKMNF